MQEDFLHYLWRYRLIDPAGLFTTTGEPLEVLNPGEYNSDAGPDFFDARIRIGATLWAGNVEIHVRASEWKSHRHDRDGAYNNTILHVVYHSDGEMRKANGDLIPTLELKERFNASLLHTYRALQENRDWIPCKRMLGTVVGDRLLVNGWLDRMVAERIEQKAFRIRDALRNNRNDWEETCYQLLARNFGFKVNAIPFEQLARSLPLSCLAKQGDSLFQMEALLFGQANLLDRKTLAAAEQSRIPYGDGSPDEGEENAAYPMRLKKEYRHLRTKFRLRPINGSQWKFSRMRPANFPAIRIAQFAALLHKSPKLFAEILTCQRIAHLEDLFHVNPSAYWETHYKFSKTSVKKKKPLGRDGFENILINTVVPLLFLYGLEKDDLSFRERALQLLEGLPGENNGVIRRWKKLGMSEHSAYYTQALLQLKGNYCNRKKCLQCAIGGRILTFAAQ